MITADNEKDFQLEKKIARLCWNSNGWVAPSGIKGKSRDSKTFECRYGFGHEEWLLDFQKTIGDYKYSFLQPLGKSKAGQTFTIYLYSYLNGVNHYVGCIRNAMTIGADEAQDVVSHYGNMGWIDSMKADLEKLGISSSALDFGTPINCFNVKFRTEDIEISKDRITIHHDFIQTPQYILYSASDDFLSYIASKSKADVTSSATELLELMDDGELSDSERLSLVNARIGQGIFRRNVINTWGQERCAVTLCGVRDILVASHIRAWKDCSTTSERLCGANGLMLSANVDKLFDRHLITFYPSHRETYRIKISSSLDRSALKQLGIDNSAILDLSMLTPSDKEHFKLFMAHHNSIFESKATD